MSVIHNGEWVQMCDNISKFQMFLLGEQSWIAAGTLQSYQLKLKWFQCTFSLHLQNAFVKNKVNSSFIKWDLESGLRPICSRRSDGPSIKSIIINPLTVAVCFLCQKPCASVVLCRDIIYVVCHIDFVITDMSGTHGWHVYLLHCANGGRCCRK